MDYGVIVDVETTGLNPEQDRVIEIGVVEFCVQIGKTPTITDMYSAIEDPQIPIPDVVKKLTGIHDEMVKERSIDWGRVAALLSRSSIIIAHNMEFDRGFLLRRSELRDISTRWACSLRHINWAKHGFTARSLTYLAADHGFVNPFPHRALFDCATTFRLVAPYLDELVARSLEQEFWIYAVGSPFETKDKLRLAGYRWDQERRVWKKLVADSERPSEREFLVREVYGNGKASIVEEPAENPTPV